MPVIIRLQNLPWSANAMDIRRFFFGLQIPDGGVHIVGGNDGDAFIAFSNDEDARRAMLLNGGRIGDCTVKLYLSSKNEMQNVIQAARTTAPPSPTDTHTTPQNVAYDSMQTSDLPRLNEAFSNDRSQDGYVDDSEVWDMSGNRGRGLNRLTDAFAEHEAQSYNKNGSSAYDNRMAERDHPSHYYDKDFNKPVSAHSSKRDDYGMDKNISVNWNPQVAEYPSQSISNPNAPPRKEVSNLDKGSGSSGAIGSYDFNRFNINTGVPPPGFPSRPNPPHAMSVNFNENTFQMKGDISKPSLPGHRFPEPKNLDLGNQQNLLPPFKEPKEKQPEKDVNFYGPNQGFYPPRKSRFANADIPGDERQQNIQFKDADNTQPLQRNPQTMHPGNTNILGRPPVDVNRVPAPSGRLPPVPPVESTPPVKTQNQPPFPFPSKKHDESLSIQNVHNQRNPFNESSSYSENTPRSMAREFKPSRFSSEVPPRPMPYDEQKSFTNESHVESSQSETPIFHRGPRFSGAEVHPSNSGDRFPPGFPPSNRHFQEGKGPQFPPKDSLNTFAPQNMPPPKAPAHATYSHGINPQEQQPPRFPHNKADDMQLPKISDNTLPGRGPAFDERFPSKQNNPGPLLPPPDFKNPPPNKNDQLHNDYKNPNHPFIDRRYPPSHDARFQDRNVAERDRERLYRPGLMNDMNRRDPQTELNEDFDENMFDTHPSHEFGRGPPPPVKRDFAPEIPRMPVPERPHFNQFQPQRPNINAHFDNIDRDFDDRQDEKIFDHGPPRRPFEFDDRQRGEDHWNMHDRDEMEHVGDREFNDNYDDRSGPGLFSKGKRPLLATPLLPPTDDYGEPLGKQNMIDEIHACDDIDFEEPAVPGDNLWNIGDGDLYIYLANLPKTVVYSDIRRFLRGCDGIKLINDDMGNRVGTAFVKFHNEEGASRALHQDGSLMGPNKIFVSPATKEEFENAVDSYRPRQPKVDTFHQQSILGPPPQNVPQHDNLPPPSLLSLPIIPSHEKSNDSAGNFQGPSVHRQFSPTRISQDKQYDSGLPSPKMDSSENQRPPRNNSPSRNTSRPRSISRSSPGGRSRNSPKRQSSRVRSRSPTRSKDNYIVIKRLPKRISRKAIRNFFGRSKIAKNGDAVHIEVHSDGADTGCALIEFETKRDLDHALQFNKRRFEGHPVGVIHITKKEYQERIDKSRENDKTYQQKKKERRERERKSSDKDNKNDTKITSQNTDVDKTKNMEGDKKGEKPEVDQGIDNDKEKQDANKNDEKVGDVHTVIEKTQTINNDVKEEASKATPKIPEKSNDTNESKKRKSNDESLSTDSKIAKLEIQSPKKSWAEQVEEEEELERKLAEEMKKSDGDKPENLSDHICVSLDGIPKNCTVKMILEFLKGIKVAKFGIHLIRLGGDQVAPICFVELVDNSQCLLARKKDRSYIGVGCVLVQSMTKPVMLQRVASEKEKFGVNSYKPNMNVSPVNEQNKSIVKPVAVEKTGESPLLQATDKTKNSTVSKSAPSIAQAGKSLNENDIVKTTPVHPNIPASNNEGTISQASKSSATIDQQKKSAIQTNTKDSVKPLLHVSAPARLDSRLVQPQQGLLKNPQQGLLKDPQQGLLKDPQQGLLKDPQQGLLKDPQQGLLKDPQQGLLKDPIRSVPTNMPNLVPPGMAVLAKNVNFKATAEDIFSIFSQFRPLKDLIKIRYGPTGRPTGDVMVPFSNEVDAQNAVATLHNVQALGRRIFLRIV